MFNGDFTVIYLTANLIPEKFAEFQRKTLVNAIGDAPIISISRKPLDFGKNMLQTGPKCTDTIYREMLRGAELAETPYIAIAEDDILYPEEHFSFFRPEKDVFAYNLNRFSLFTWGRPTYSWRNRKANATLIAPRNLMIAALEERFTKYPEPIPDQLVGELGRSRVEKNLKLTPRKSVEVFSNISVVQINHDVGSDEIVKKHKKALGPIQAYDIPYWGLAAELVKKYE